MFLQELIEKSGLKLEIVPPGGNSNPEITALAYDSRAVVPGALFAALPGAKTDGGEFVRAALAQGAVAVLGGLNLDTSAGREVPSLLAENPRLALSRLANAFYDFPSRKLKLIGITGTNGKTTTAFIVRYLLRSLNRRAGMLGTIEYDTGAKVIPAPLTTPESVDFAKYLAEAAAAHCEFAVAETSSHALALDRVAGCEFAAGIFSNLTRDHLDYHGDFEHYAAAKRKLFSLLPPTAPAVVNIDDPHGESMLSASAARRETFAVDNSQAVWNAVDITADINGSRFTLRHAPPGGEVTDYPVFLPLPGWHNIYNAVSAVAVLANLGLSVREMLMALMRFPGVPGRLEKINSAGRMVFIDYAHTPDALEKILATLKPLTKQSLWTVFGCGGDRDKGKRPQMAAVAEKFSDRVIVTNDNPRTENPEEIIADITGGFADNNKVTVIPERAEAIARAVKYAAPGDTVVIAGKGHENYQIVGTVKHHFSDRECVEQIWN